MNILTEIYLGWMKARNQVDFGIRQRFHPNSRPIESPEIEKPEITGGYSEETRNQAGHEIDRLTEIYHFDYFFAARSYDQARENYFYLAMLDRALEQARVVLPDCLEAADIGPSSWFYVRALYASLIWHRAPSPRSVHLTGYEVDAYRMYSDFHTRKDHAMGNLHGLPGVEYCDQRFTTQPQTYDVVTLFFPFVFQKDHLKWGLPVDLFNPAGLLKSAWESLKNNGVMIIVNQGEEEHDAEKALLNSLRIPITGAFRMDSLLYQYPLDRYIITINK